MANKEEELTFTRHKMVDFSNFSWIIANSEIFVANILFCSLKIISKKSKILDGICEKKSIDVKKIIFFTSKFF